MSSRAHLLVATVSLGMCSAVAAADITGFGNLSPSQWTVNSPDSGNPPTFDQATGTLRLTNPVAGERRSVWFNVPQTVSQFTASFTYRTANVSWAFGGGCGAAFVLQNSAAGIQAVGNGSAFGYSGIGNSAGVTLELYNGTSSSGLYFNGNVGGGSFPTSPLNLLSGNPIDVNISFDGALLRVSMLDTVTGQLFSPPPYIATNLLSNLGGSTALVGFVANTTGNERGDQFISNFRFAVPSPGAVGVLMLGGLVAHRRRR